MVNAKKKGNHGENLFANWLQNQGIKAFRNSRSGAGINKSDVHNALNANFEVKTCKKAKLAEWWKQTSRDSNLTHSTPYLAIHLDGMPENKWLMVLDNDDWAELIMKPEDEKVAQQETTNDYAQKYAIQNAITSLKKLLKFYD